MLVPDRLCLVCPVCLVCLVFLVCHVGIFTAGDRDFLEARILHEVHPTGEPIEVYILTSEKGAHYIRERCGMYGLQVCVFL